ncbi:FAD-dependent monooxygenase [Kitasatospora sp. NPDC056531]|uniref:FAD-dependent monooxygenase n=1 Tax=Kitasatospora sp. NPDC056531 TaxID=3345856 RepID=UPI0036777C40
MPADEQPPAQPDAGRALAPQVLIVGAGPIGMALACELLQQNVGVRLIDRQERIDTSDPHSKAVLVWPRNLEMLRRIGVADALVREGRRTSGLSYYSEGRLLGTADLSTLTDSPYPFILALPQRDTERILRARLAELGGVIERGVELVSLDGSGAEPRALLKHPDGTSETVEPRWLVGADGPASTVRSELGIRFDGEEIDVTYAIGDVPISGDVPPLGQYYYCRDGVAAIVPLSNGSYRFAATTPHRREEDGNPSRELIQHILSSRSRRDIQVGTPDWTRAFRPRLGIAETFSKGRCFLVGDAAHVVSPAGGQGLNVGLMDVANLGWKLAGVANGTLRESILESYAPERQAGATRLSRTSAAQARFALQRSVGRIAVRDTLFTVACKTGLVSRMVVPLLSQIDVSYGRLATEPILLRHPRPIEPGQRVPMFVAPELDSGMPAIDPAHYTVLLWPGRRPKAEWAQRARQLRAKLDPSITVLDLARVGGGPARTLDRTFGRNPAFAVVRPDGHLALLAGADRPDQVLAFLRGARPAEPVTAPIAAH